MSIIKPMQILKLSSMAVVEYRHNFCVGCNIFGENF